MAFLFNAVNYNYTFPNIWMLTLVSPWFHALLNATKPSGSPKGAEYLNRRLPSFCDSPENKGKHFSNLQSGQWYVEWTVECKLWLGLFSEKTMAFLLWVVAA